MASGLVVLYFHRPGAPRRRALEDHLLCWRRYGTGRTLYLNAALGHGENALRALEPTAVVLHTSFLAQRWSSDFFAALASAYGPLFESRPFVVAIPQDEFLQTEALETCLETFGARLVLSCADRDDAGKIYPRFLARGGRVERVLTGYFEPTSLRRLAGFRGTPHRERPCDLGYRAWKAEPWLGRHGLLKREIAERAAAASGPLGLRVDLSLEESAVLHGDAWYRFLASSRATLGVEGGSSILDRDGSIRARTNAFVAENPSASFAEIEAACFPGADGSLRLFCISPRHLEACATGTAQILVEGGYNGILEPERHYFPVRRDLGDLDRALRWLRDEPDRAAAMAGRAFQEVLGKRELTYPSFVERFERWLDEEGVAWKSGSRRFETLRFFEPWRGLYAATRCALWRWKQRVLRRSAA